MRISKAVGYMLISVVSFAVMNLCVKFLHRLPATELVLFRCFISLCLCWYFIKKGGIPPWGNNKKFLILRGVFGVLGLVLIYYTLQKLPLATAVTLGYLSPIFTAIFAALFLKEHIKLWQWTFFLISFAGIAVVKGFDPNVDFKLLMMGVGGALFAGMAYTCVRKLKDSDHPMVVVFYFPLIATPIMGVVALFYWVTPVGREWPLILIMGLLTQAAQVYMTKALQAAEVSEVINLKYLGILFAIGFDLFIFNLDYNPYMLVGIALVLMGVLLNSLYKTRNRRKHS